MRGSGACWNEGLGKKAGQQIGIVPVTPVPDTSRKKYFVHMGRVFHTMVWRMSSFNLSAGLIFLLACSVHFVLTIVGNFCRIPENSPKSSADKMHRACE